MDPVTWVGPVFLWIYPGDMIDPELVAPVALGGDPRGKRSRKEDPSRMAAFSGPLQNSGVLGMLVSEPPGMAQVALQQASEFLGQPSPGLVPRTPIGPATPVPPTSGTAAPLPGETNGDGSGTFGNMVFQNATANVQAAAQSGKGGGVDISA